MDWTAIATIAEVVSALAVIVSLVYLAKQINQSASDVRASIVHSLHSNEVQIQGQPAADPGLAVAVEKAYTGQQLTDTERAQFSMWLYSALINFEQVFLEYKRLGVESDLFDAQAIRIAGGLEPPIAKAVWQRLQDRFSNDFQTFVASNCLDFQTADLNH